MIRSGLACALALLPSLAFGQTKCSWSTDDDFILNTTTDASAATVIADPGSGIEYAAGMSTDGVTGHWVVRKRNSGTWTTVDDFIYSIGLRNAPRAMLRDPGGRLFVVGGANNLSNSGHWLVRRSSNAGSTWTTVDDFSDPNVPASAAMAVTADGSNVLVGGWHWENSLNQYHWVARKSGSNGTTWSTSSDVAPISSSAGIQAMDTDPSGNIFAVGYNWDGTGYHWQVRRRAASATTWTLVDDQPATTYSFTPVAVVAPASNVVYVAGYQWAALTSQPSWVVRRTTNGGTTWTTVDSFTNNSQTCAARGIGWNAQDSSVYATGRCYDGTAYHWMVRRTDNGGTSWTTDDDYQLATGATAFPGAINATSGGHVYAAGVANDGSHNHWIVRRRACTAVAPGPAAASVNTTQTVTSGTSKQTGIIKPPSIRP